MSTQSDRNRANFMRYYSGQDSSIFMGTREQSVVGAPLYCCIVVRSTNIVSKTPPASVGCRGRTATLKLLSIA